MKYLALIVALVCTISVSAQTSDSPYEKEYGYADGLALVLYKGKYGYIDTRKKEVIEVKYAQAGSFNNGIARVSLDGKRYGYINKQGKIVVPLEYDEFKIGFIDGLSPAKKNGKWGIITDKGKTTIPHEYHYLGYFNEGLALASIIKNGAAHYGFINEKGKEVVPFEYEDAGGFSEDHAIVKKNNLYGLIDRKGKVVIPLVYTGIRGLNNGMVAVQSGKDKKWGFLDLSGRFVIPLHYDNINSNSFQFGEAEVQKGDKTFYIDKNGKELPKGRWLFIFTKGIKTGEQFWYRGSELDAAAIKEKQKEGFRFYDVSQNQHKREYFIIMSKFSTSWQSGINYRYDDDKAWEKMKAFYKEGRNMTSISYGIDKWSMVASDFSYKGETAVTNIEFPWETVNKNWENGKFITLMASGDKKWFVVMRNVGYDAQKVEIFSGGWDQKEVDRYQKMGYHVTSVAVDEDEYYVVFTKGTGIKEQKFLWSEDIPMREINQLWDKGYQSYRSFYLPRNTTLDKQTNWDMFW